MSITLNKFMAENYCSEWSKMRECFPDMVGLVFNMKDVDYRYIVSFKERISSYGTIKSINFVDIYADFASVGGIDIESIAPISKKDLTAEEVTYLFTYPAAVFADTAEFQEFYGLMTSKEKHTEAPYFITKENLDMKIGHLKEELAEIEKAAAEGDLAEFADGIIDLIYVAAGLGALCRLPMNTLWNDVQNSNMIGKVRVTSLDDATKRGSTFDVKKGPNWVGPRGKDIIETVAKIRTKYSK